jgi:hypothetical protein
LRWCADDLKAFYSEAAMAQPGSRTAEQIMDWFWLTTSAGTLLNRLRIVILGDEDPGIMELGIYMLVPEKYERTGEDE